MKSKFFNIMLFYRLDKKYPLELDNRKQRLTEAIQELLSAAPYLIQAFINGEVTAFVERGDGTTISPDKFQEFLRNIPDWTEIDNVEILGYNKPPDSAGSVVIGRYWYYHDTIDCMDLSDDVIKNVLLNKDPDRGVNLMDMISVLAEDSDQAQIDDMENNEYMTRVYKDMEW